MSDKTKNISSSPENSEFDSDHAIVNEVDGWFSKHSHALFDILLCFQKKHIKGNLLEVGVWKGRSACVLAKYRRNDEFLFLIDPLINMVEHKEKTMNAIRALSKDVSSNILFLAQKSFDFIRNDGATKLYNGVRFMHIDGEHTGYAVNKDMELANNMMSTDGILVVDDFFNASYPQITQSVFTYMNNNPYHFKMLMCGFNKAYLCRPSFFTHYSQYIFENLNTEMEARGVPISLCKTSSIGDSEIFGLCAYNENNKTFKQKRGTDDEKEIMDIVQRVKV